MHIIESHPAVGFALYEPKKGIPSVRLRSSSEELEVGLTCLRVHFLLGLEGIQAVGRAARRNAFQVIFRMT